MVQIHVDTWRLDLPPLPGTFLSFNISAKPVWPSLSSLQPSEIEKLRDRSRAAQLDHFLESPLFGKFESGLRAVPLASLILPYAGFGSNKVVPARERGRKERQCYGSDQTPICEAQYRHSKSKDAYFAPLGA
jgi:hypothetical protein